MKAKHAIFSFYVCVSALVIAFCLFSCSNDFLSVTNPDGLNTSNFPATLSDLEYLVNNAYGTTLRKGFLSGPLQARIGAVAHYDDQAYSNIDFDAGAQVNFSASTSTDVTTLWTGHYENINKVNSALEAIVHLKDTNHGLTVDELQTLAYREGELRFLRAFNYYYLINFFGESFITDAADENKMGVPLIRAVASSIESTNSPRATVGEVWNFIKSDLATSAALLASKPADPEKARVTTWAAKSFLGKALVFTQKWDSAKIVLKDVIDNSGKMLVPFSIYKDMFNSQHPFNDESIFEVNYNETKLLDPIAGSWNTVANDVSNYQIFIAPYYVTAAGTVLRNGYGNYVVHDKSLLRFGWTDGEKVNYSSQSYIDLSESIRASNSLDPRVWVNVLQPTIDSITIDDVRVAVYKNNGEISGSNNLVNSYGWGMRKFSETYRNWGGDAKGTAINLYWLRLADVFLLYAEACSNANDGVTALEYINKVRRRAHSVSIDVPDASVDYASLTSATAASISDPLRNDPLKYERWLELFGEQANWWFDVCRWKVGQGEAAYYQGVTSGPLIWDDNRSYALPIPTYEININPVTQNPGY